MVTTKSTGLQIIHLCTATQCTCRLQTALFDNKCCAIHVYYLQKTTNRCSRANIAFRTKITLSLSLLHGSYSADRVSQSVPQYNYIIILMLFTSLVMDHDSLPMSKLF